MKAENFLTIKSSISSGPHDFLCFIFKSTMCNQKKTLCCDIKPKTECLLLEALSSLVFEKPVLLVL